MVGNALAVERLRAQPALAVWIVDDRNRLGEDLVAEPILQKARAARDGWPRDRTKQVRDKSARDARVEHYRATAGRHLFGAQALDRTLAGAFAAALRERLATDGPASGPDLAVGDVSARDVETVLARLTRDAGAAP